MLDELPDQIGTLEDRLVFCTECESELQDFCFSEWVDNLEELKRNHVRCKKKGRFVGEPCAKLFIADPQYLNSVWIREGT